MLDYAGFLGRSYVPGETDIYGLIQKFFQDKLNITLTKWGFPDRWWTTGENLLLDNLKADGFRLVDIPVYEVRPGDLILAADADSIVPNRLAVFVGNGMILFANPGRLSGVYPLTGMFRDRLCAILRHPSVVVEPKVGTANLLDLVSPQNHRVLSEVIEKIGASS